MGSQRSGGFLDLSQPTTKVQRQMYKYISDCVIDTDVVPGERGLKVAVEGAWKLLSPWEYTSRTHQLLLVVLVEHIMPLMDNSIYLTDYFMDTLNNSRECSLLFNCYQLTFVFSPLSRLFTCAT